MPDELLQLFLATRALQRTRAKNRVERDIVLRRTIALGRRPNRPTRATPRRASSALDFRAAASSPRCSIARAAMSSEAAPAQMDPASYLNQAAAQTLPALNGHGASRVSGYAVIEMRSIPRGAKPRRCCRGSAPASGSRRRRSYARPGGGARPARLNRGSTS